jgi:adenylate cyclase
MNYTPKPLLFEATAADPVATWLFGEARELPDSRSVVGEFCRRLVASDFGLYRLALTARTLHPQVVAIGYVWRRGDSEPTETPREHGILEDPVYLQSPVKRIHDGAPEVRRRLEGPDAVVDFPILEELQAEGVTDYIALPVPFSHGRKNVIMAATDQPGGFSEGELARLRGLLPLLSLVLEVKETKRILRTLLDVYLGHDAGRRVLGGLIKRGDGITLAAALWYCDLRGFTAIAETLPRDATIALLNDYFECMVGPVKQHGGEVLKFIGDAMLAIFPIADDLDRDRACHAALAAAETALADLAHLNERRRAAGRATLEVGIALHMGAVTYGNIGGPDRLDFTVVGPAVNLVTRLEGLCSELGQPLLASARFASPCGSKLVSLGYYPLRGFAEQQEVFTLPAPSPVVRTAAEAAAP